LRSSKGPGWRTWLRELKKNCSATIKSHTPFDCPSHKVTPFAPLAVHNNAS
jgi:hypothetical protein